MTHPRFPDPFAAREALLERVQPVEDELLELSSAAGRILCEAIHADRDSPATDVSAMDGYAVRLEGLAPGVLLPLAGEVTTGQPAPPLPLGATLRVLTGGAVPAGTDAVVPRELVDESPDHISLRPTEHPLTVGQNIRRRGENARAGTPIVDAGQLIGAPVSCAAATFGVHMLRVARPVRVAVLTTGDEVVAAGGDGPVTAERVRDGNGPALWAALAGLPYVRRTALVHVLDEPGALREAISAAIATADAVILTGGVSKGTHDHVPDAIRSAGAEVVFHRLPIRPGKPVLGAVTPVGQPIYGLPGNPVSALTCFRWFVEPALRRRAGAVPDEPDPALVELVNGGSRTLDLWWYRPVRRGGVGRAHPCDGRGSGDVVALAQSDGFVLLPPGASGAGPWPFYPWTA